MIMIIPKSLNEVAPPIVTSFKYTNNVINRLPLESCNDFGIAS